VADATVGLASDEHAPNGGMFMTGAKSVMLAEGVLVRTRPSGSTTRLEGATPKLHIMVAPVHTAMATVSPWPRRRRAPTAAARRAAGRSVVAPCETAGRRDTGPD